MKKNPINLSLRSAVCAFLIIAALTSLSLWWSAVMQRRIGDFTDKAGAILDKIDATAENGEIPPYARDEILAETNAIRESWDAFEPFAALGVPHGYLRDVDSAIAQLEGSLDGYDSSQIGAGAHMALVALRQIRRLSDLSYETVI